MSNLRLLIRPILFTTGVCGTCFCGAAIYHYENKRRAYPSLREWVTVQKQRSNLSRKYLTFRQQVNQWYNQLSTGQKIACGTIFINLLVLGAWRINGMRPIMMKYFISQTPGPKMPLSPMVLSCFSHTMPLHFFFNMYALYSFAPFANSLLGPEQLVGLFLSAGVVSSLASICYRLAIGRTVSSLGASGALLGVIAYVCVARPDAELLLIFIPLSGGVAIKTLMAIDTIGLLAKWRLLDHAAHLGGSAFGVWYAMRGEKLFYDHRRKVVEHWLKIKKMFDD